MPRDPSPRPITPVQVALRWPDCSSPDAQEEGTARVLAALAGQSVGGRASARPESDGAPGDTAACVTTGQDPRGVEGEQLAETTVLGPRMGLSLEACHWQASGGLWSPTEPADQSTPAADPVDELDLADEVDAQLTGLQGDLMSDGLELSRWPEDDVDPAQLLARDAEMACLAVLNEEVISGEAQAVDSPGLPTTVGDLHEDGAPHLDPRQGAGVGSHRDGISEDTTGRDEVPVGEPASSRQPMADGQTAGHEEDRPERPPVAPGEQATETIKAPRGPVSRWRTVRLNWGRRGRLDGEALREKRRQVFRRALAGGQEEPKASSGVSQRWSAKMTRTLKPTWKPRDPFADGVPTRSKGFRWYTMLLTAGGVAGTGYAIMRLLLMAGMITV